MAVRGPLTRNAAGTIVGNKVECTDENYTVVEDDTIVELITTGAGSRTLTLPTTTVQTDGKLLIVHMTALSTGTYATSGAVGGEVTFDADETFHIFVSEAGVGYHSMRLTDAALATNEVSDAKLRQSAALSVIGRSANSTGNVADISASAGAGGVLRESSNTIGFGTVAAAGIATGAITPVKVLDTLVAPAANAACALLNTTTQVELTVTDGTNTAISTTSSVAGQEIYLRAMAVAGGGSYTLAVTGGTLTLNSTGEAAIIKRDNTNAAWYVMALTASSSTAANVATIV